jgi:hypothetical protein
MLERLAPLPHHFRIIVEPALNGLENQIRGLLKNLGLDIGRAKMNASCAAELIETRPYVAAAIEPLLKAREEADCHRGSDNAHYVFG